jgi:ankyrin repeat protein
MARWLLEECREDANAADDAAMTPLMVAAQADAAPLAQLLLRRGAALERGSATGCTPLHHAASAGALALCLLPCSPALTLLLALSDLMAGG